MFICLFICLDSLNKEFCAWMGARTVSAFIDRENKIHLLELLGASSNKLKRIAKTSRQLKADGGRPNLKQPKLDDDKIDEKNKQIS